MDLARAFLVVALALSCRQALAKSAHSDERSPTPEGVAIAVEFHEGGSILVAPDGAMRMACAGS